MNQLTLAAGVLVAFGSPLTLSVAAAWQPSAGGGPPGAGAPYQALDAGDVFVATITRVQDEGATNARPPRVWMKVHEVLKGQAKTVRSPALWSPPYHEFDFGDGNQPELRRWYAAPLKGPKVGQKFILGGQPLKTEPGEKEEDPPPALYDLFAFVRIPYTDASRAEAIRTLAALDAAHRKYAADQAAAAKERRLRLQKWRTDMTALVIDRRTQQADAVAIARFTSGWTCEIETMLKGRRRMSTGGKYFLTVPAEGYDPRIADIVSQPPRCILFLSEKNLIASVGNGIEAQLVHPYEGVVPADAEAIAAVKASLHKRPPPKPRPVLVISELERGGAGPLAEAARSHFAVVTTRQYSFNGSHVVAGVRDTIPHASMLVMVDRGPRRRVVAVRIAPDDAATIYDESWPEGEVDERFKALLRRLVEASD